LPGSLNGRQAHILDDKRPALSTRPRDFLHTRVFRPAPACNRRLSRRPSAPTRRNIDARLRLALIANQVLPPAPVFCDRLRPNDMTLSAVHPGLKGDKTAQGRRLRGIPRPQDSEQ